MTPDGGAALTSKSFTGSTSDHELTIRSHYLDLLPVAGYGALIMADQGFDIRDLLMPHGVKLNIQAIKQQMALEDVQKTQQIATLRIHVECLMERIREFSIFSKIVPTILFPIIIQIWIVRCLLTIFQAPLLAEANYVFHANCC